MLFTNRIPAGLLAFSVCLNVGLFQSFMNRPGSGEKLLQVSHDGTQITLTVGSGEGYPVSVVMNSDQARALARSMSEQADEIDGGLMPTVEVINARNDELEQPKDQNARTRDVEIQEKMRKVRSENPFESY